eukprot:scaffold57042_cov52-Attheya_sp.AAC.2
MAEPMALQLHDNQSFTDQLGYVVHQTAVQTMAHLKKDTVLKSEDGHRGAGRGGPRTYYLLHSTP